MIAIPRRRPALRLRLLLPIVASALALAACGKTDFAGSHAGRAQGSYFDGRKRTSLDAPSETVDVKRDGKGYALTFRGCAVRGEVAGEGLVRFPEQPCEIDLPNGVGRVRLTVRGQLAAITSGSPFAKLIRATLTLDGSDTNVVPNRALTYLVEPVYDPSGAP